MDEDNDDKQMESGRTELLYFFEWYKNLGPAVGLVDQWQAAPYFTFGHKRTPHASHHITSPDAILLRIGCFILSLAASFVLGSEEERIIAIGGTDSGIPYHFHAEVRWQWCAVRYWLITD